jgi:hypothetical protein
MRDAEGYDYRVHGDVISWIIWIWESSLFRGPTVSGSAPWDRVEKPSEMIRLTNL